MDLEPEICFQSRDKKLFSVVAQGGMEEFLNIRQQPRHFSD